MKKIISLLFFACSIAFAQKEKVPLQPIIPSVNVTCSVGCEGLKNSSTLVSASSLTYPASINNTPCITAPSGFNSGCLSTYPNQRWIIIKTTSAGSLTFTITNSSNIDVDAAIWGPIPNNDNSLACSVVQNAPISCDYRAAANPVVSISNAQAGQSYVLLVTNFSNGATDITINQPTGGSVSYNYACDDYWVLNNPITGTQLYKAKNYIESTSTISTASNVKYIAGNKVELKTGFKTSDQAVFEAKIENGCLGNYVLTLQPDATTGKDADIASMIPNTVSNTAPYFDPYAWTQSGGVNVKRCLIQFDLSSIPTGAVIDSAYLSLYFSQKLIQDFPIFSGHSGINTLEIMRITQNWQANTVTWSNQPTTIATNELIVPMATTLTQNYPNLNVKDLVIDQINNGNYGFLIKHQTETAYKITCLTTSEETNSSIRPKLVIYYHL